eukprot:COSAG06_NODE_3453_length_5320_cov_49.582839_3_plen_93_part_00
MWVSGELVACITAARPTSAAAVRPSMLRATPVTCHLSRSICAQCFLVSGFWSLVRQKVADFCPLPRLPASVGAILGALTRPLQRRHEHITCR